MRRIGDKFYLSSAQASDRIGISVTLLSVWRKRETVVLPCIKLGGKVFYEADGVDAYLKKIGAIDE